MIHVLKTWPKYYDAVAEGIKRFEVCENDRNFQVGDKLILREFIPEYGDDQILGEHPSGSYTGHAVIVDVTYVMYVPGQDNLVAISIGPPQYVNFDQLRAAVTGSSLDIKYGK